MTKKRFFWLFFICVALFCSSLTKYPIKQSVLAAPLASCSGESCTDKNPYTTGCSTDSYMVKSVNLLNSSLQPVGILSLMYSPSCHSVWTLNQVTVGTTNLLSATARRLNPDKIAGNIQQGSNLTTTNSNMIYLASGQQARAYGYIGYTGGVYFTQIFTAP